MEKETSPRIRLTISVPADVHATFQRLAKASGTSLGWAMGEWLGDTLEAVELTTTMVERARSAPKQVIREMHAMALGFSDETGSAMKAMRRPGGLGELLRSNAVTVPAAPAPSGGRPGSPPSSNTGGKVPRENPKKGRR